MTKQRRIQQAPEQIVRKLRAAEEMQNAGNTIGEVGSNWESVSQPFTAGILSTAG